MAELGVFFVSSCARACLVAAALAIGGIAGCGPSAPKTVPVAGTVTLGGQPLASGAVTFKPLTSRASAEPVGTIAEGKYTLATGAQEGAPEGKYKVIVNASAPSKPDDPYSVPKSLVPKRYTDAKTTDLEVEVLAQPAAGAYDLKLTP